MPIIVDAHADLAYNMLKYGRNYTRSALETRRLEAGSAAVIDNEDCIIGWPDYQRGQVAVIFSTIYATPARWSTSENKSQVYKTFDEAHALYHEQLMIYHRMTDSASDKFRLVASSRDLNLILDHWNSPSPSESGHPVGMVVLMEGAEGIRNLSELDEWYELGVRLIGPAWVGTRYCGGWKEPGPLTADGRKLLSAMADHNFILDLSHMDEQAAVEALDIYRGPIVGTHGNCLSLMPNSNSNRHFSDGVIEGIIERDGVMGVVPYNSYLKTGWVAGQNERSEVPLDYVASHIDHICQIAGDALHAGIGSDFDGGFGLQSVPPEIDTIADLQNLVSLLEARGYNETDIANIFGGNWLKRLFRDLPAS
ncbi:MAG TPA: membrane dipeptidase [Anaerolineales bacterium]|nr:membrane dipeptidase [Anaerolineales bacterium]